jgi:XapX domain-containing protein
VKSYLISLAIGIFVGVIYGLVHVRSPAPPLVALIGLLGMLVGEQIPIHVKQVFNHGSPGLAWVGDGVKKSTADAVPGEPLPRVNPNESQEKP